MPQFFQSILSDELTLSTYLLCSLCALLCGGIAAAAASFRTRPTRSFLLSLLILPVIVQTVITMVSGNVGTGIAVAGAFSLVRFRSTAGRADQIASIFLVMAAGLTCAAGYIVLALLFTLLVSAVLMAFTALPAKASREMLLKITVPESLNIDGAFDEVFAEYTREHKLLQVKTTNMGSLYRLQYRVTLLRPTGIKEFLDALRCRNGNLEISLNEEAEGGEEL